MTNWNTEYTIETKASTATLWALLRDVSSWSRWNAGVQRIVMDGPFATGTAFEMHTGDNVLHSTLVEVRENERFVDETRVDDLVVRVTHQLDRVGAGTRVTFALDAIGPGSAEIGPHIAADFPDVLRSLAALAEQTPAR